MRSQDLYQIWTQVAGRCAFPGCNLKLLQEIDANNITNIGELCHIIGRSPDGPRGHPTRSELLREDPDNIILLCGNHHKIVDAKPAKYTEEELRKMRDEYTKWVDEQLDYELQQEIFTGLIISDTDFGRIDEVTIKQQLFPNIMLRNVFEFSTNGRPTTEAQWNTVETELETWWKDVSQTEGISHSYAIFSISYIPILIYLGFLIRDTSPTKFFQYNRRENSWKWPEVSNNQPQLFTTLSELSDDSTNTEIAISICLSAKIQPEEIYAVLPSDLEILEVYLPEPSRDWLQTEKQLGEFETLFLAISDKLLQKKPNLELIHLFCTCPTPIAFIIGSLINPSMFPVVQTYNYYRSDTPRYCRAIRFND